ncbi:MAG: hypothetical protein QM759_02835 [Terricaulis sp.]
MKRAVLFCALLALSACQWDPPHQGARDGGVPALEVGGYGPLHIGMSLQDARASTGQAMNSAAFGDESTCVEEPFYAADGDTLYAMFEHGRLTRITVNNQAMHTRTVQNIGVGSKEEEVRTAYTNVVLAPRLATDPSARSLVVWTEPSKSGLRFEIDGGGQVMSIHAGAASIMDVQGCA